MNDDDFLNTISDTDKERNDSNAFAATEAAAVAGAGLDFDGLYDKETEEGSSYRREEDDDDIKKKTKAPVIICIICAIICVIAVLLLLFVVPSKYNLLSKKKTNSSTQIVEKTETIEEKEPEPVIEPEPEPEIEAKEDEIVVITEPEIVETIEPEKPAEPEKPKEIIYTIKWGDTLWDIADAYYKNPWQYHMIAKYNGIKNPDYIISTTKIKLPQK